MHFGCLQLYKQYVGPHVQHEDLFTAEGVYNRKNKYNRDSINGAMHLVVAPNTLEAELELGAAATILRQNQEGSMITAEQASAQQVLDQRV